MLQRRMIAFIIFAGLANIQPMDTEHLSDGWFWKTFIAARARGAGIAENLRRAFAHQENNESCLPPARRNAAVAKFHFHHRQPGTRRAYFPASKKNQILCRHRSNRHARGGCGPCMIITLASRPPALAKA